MLWVKEKNNSDLFFETHEKGLEHENAMGQEEEELQFFISVN